MAAINADDDPRTTELKDSYLRPLGITTLLDAPIVRSGLHQVSLNLVTNAIDAVRADGIRARRA